MLRPMQKNCMPQRNYLPGLPVSWLEECRRNAAAYAKKLYAAAELFGGPAAENTGSKRTAAIPAALSRRERAVLSHLSQGFTREEIAAAQGLSINTIKSTIRSIYNKLGALNQADAIRVAAGPPNSSAAAYSFFA
ncbi:hypothetical protein AGMMS50255_8340 [Spirochaetia bacterium]|nr:hypothetical protein AGMMS50255_8340 [Spirochaetia bacterium]